MDSVHKLEHEWSEPTKPLPNNKQMILQRIMVLLQAAATRMGNEATKLKEVTKKGSVNTRHHPRSHGLMKSMQAERLRKQAVRAEEEDEAIVFFGDEQHLMVDPECLLLHPADQDTILFPTLQLLELQHVEVMEPLEAVLSVFRLQLAEDRIIPRKRRSLTPTKRMRIPRRLISTDEIKRRKLIERKLSLIRKGRFAPPSSNVTAIILVN